MTRTNYRTAATLVIRDADGMTPTGRRRLARWLRQQANMLRDHGANYAPKFTARYVETPDVTV